MESLELATHLVGRELEGSLRRHRLGHAEIHVLAMLAGEGQARLGDLHRRGGLRRSTLTGVLDRLEARGWLGREIDPDDRRGVVVRLTTSGRAAARQTAAAVTRLEEAIAGRLAARDVEGLRRVLAAIEAVAP